jgi:hypothetical protein
MAIRQPGLGRQKRWQFPKQQSASHQAWSSDKAPYGQSLLLLPPTLGSSTTNSHVVQSDGTRTLLAFCGFRLAIAALRRRNIIENLRPDWAGRLTEWWRLRPNCDCGHEVVAGHVRVVGAGVILASPDWASMGWKKAATHHWANVADFSARFFKGLAVHATHRWHEASEILRVIACRYRHKVCEVLWPATARYLCKTSKAQLAAVALVALVSAVIGFLATGTFLRRPVAVEALELEVAPSPPKLSWITFYELQHAQKLGRFLLDISPAQLLSKYEREGDAAVDVYRDGWVKLDYPITSFDRQAFNKANYDVVEAKAHFNSVFPDKIIAVFDEQKWHARLAMHRIGDQIVAFCQFKDIEREQVLTDIQQLWFYGIRCDLPER